MLFYFWFAPENVKSIPRMRRVETLAVLLEKGFNDLAELLSGAPPSKRIAGWWVKVFATHPSLRPVSELFFRVYFMMANARRRK